MSPVFTLLLVILYLASRIISPGKGCIVVFCMSKFAMFACVSAIKDTVLVVSKICISLLGEALRIPILLPVTSR